MSHKTSVLLLSLFFWVVSAQAADAATAYYVQANDVYARSHAEGYAMGRLYYNQRMDIQYIDSNGWAYGYAYGYIQRCVWAQFSVNGAHRFWTHGTSVSDKCRSTDKNLIWWEFTNGEIWSNSSNTDGVLRHISQATYIWDNWVWGQAWGNHNYRGISNAGSLWKIRYTTYDGGGVMARPCDSSGCASDWVFIQRSSL